MCFDLITENYAFSHSMTSLFVLFFFFYCCLQEHMASLHLLSQILNNISKNQMVFVLFLEHDLQLLPFQIVTT